jgi:hypothetical protein
MITPVEVGDGSAADHRGGGPRCGLVPVNELTLGAEAAAKVASSASAAQNMTPNQRGYGKIRVPDLVVPVKQDLQIMTSIGWALFLANSRGIL